jgi:hypothetical protein
MSETLTEHYNVIVRDHHHDKAVPVTVTNTKGREVEIKFSESEKTVVSAPPQLEFSNLIRAIGQLGQLDHGQSSHPRCHQRQDYLLPDRQQQ